MYQVYQDYNRDKELMPANPTPVVQRFGNLAAGTGVNEALHALRLNPCAQATHPEIEVDQMQVDYIKNIFGYIATFKWKSTHNVGDIVFSKNAAPIWPMSEYASRIKDSQEIYYVPPVAYLAGMYRDWRGSLEMRGDIVASRYHVGKLLISYLPGNWTSNSSNPTFMELKAGLTVEVALSDGNAQFSVIIPFIYDLPYCPTPDQGKYDEQLVPGRIFVSVLTPLSTTCVVAPDVDINLYLRGGPDFEVAIPRAPLFGLSWDVSIQKGDLEHEAKARQGYYPMYAGTWHYFNASKSAIFRWGTLSDRVAEFDGAEWGYYYKVHGSDAKMLGSTGIEIAGKRTLYKDLWFVPFDDKDGNGLIYMGVCISEDAAKQYWCDKDTAGNFKPRGKKNDKGVFIWDPNLGYAISDQFVGDWTPDTYRLRLVGTQCPNFPKDKVLVFSSDNEDEWAFVNNPDRVIGHVLNEREAQPIQITPQPIGPVGGSILQFGEKFSDLKDLIRRYWYVTTIKLPSQKKFSSSASVIIPVLPNGKQLDVANNTVDAYMRDGLYAMIAAQYRFFRGGMRLKLVFENNTSSTIMFTATHRPDILVDQVSVIDKEAARKYHLRPYDVVMPRGFAQTFTVSTYNPTFEVEIPYYLRSERGLLQAEPTDTSAYFATHLGCLVLDFISNSSGSEVQMQIFSSGADDMRFDEYQGHPPVFPIRAAGTFDLINPSPAGASQPSV